MQFYNRREWRETETHMEREKDRGHQRGELDRCGFDRVGCEGFPCTLPRNHKGQCVCDLDELLD